MARTALTVQVAAIDGLAASYSAANADGHSIPNDGKTVLHVKNGATDVVVTAQTPFTQDGQDLEDPAVTVTASTEEFLGPWPPRSFNIKTGADAGSIYIDFDDVSNVTVAAIRVG